MFNKRICGWFFAAVQTSRKCGRYISIKFNIDTSLNLVFNDVCNLKNEHSL